MPRCNICNDFVLAQWPPARLHEHWFAIHKEAEKFKRAAASGCVPCGVVLQAIALYAPNFRAELSQTGLMSEGWITLRGKDNEALRILFELHENQLERPNARLELFEEWDHSENHAPLFSAVGLGSNPPDVLDITYAGWRAKRWISRCDDEHECGGDDVPLLPARVLAIMSDPVKLIVPPSGATGRFAALSYCWGSTGNLTTTSNNIKEREAAIQWETLPDLFQDVVQITRQLGIHYLWIDALCIIQDDQADWQRESSKMGDIYAAAYVTIACDAATDTSYRLTTPRNCALSTVVRSLRHISEEPAPRDERLKALAPVIIDGHAHSFFVRNPLDHEDILEETPLHELSFPLMLRGWTMQERLLSRRILHFTAHEMIWECRKTYYCECGGVSRCDPWEVETAKGSFERAKAILNSDRTTSLPNLTCPGDTPRTESFVLFWTKLMATYTARRLTFESDRLPGISAIARNLALGKTYIAGLWLEDLPWHLAWRVDPYVDYGRPSVYNGPTWSWASVSTKVRWPYYMQTCSSQIRVMEASTAPLGLDEFGQVAWGRVRLQARVAAAKALITDHSNPLLVTSYGEWPFDLDLICAKTDFEEGKGQMPSGQRSARTAEDFEDVWCILILGKGEFGDPAFCSLWIMVVAKPEGQSIQRALLDPNDRPESIICERIGCMGLGMMGSMEDSNYMGAILEWLSSSEFKEKEIIII